MIEIAGLGACNWRGEYNAYEIIGPKMVKVIDVMWYHPWGQNSRHSMCEINGRKYYVIAIGAPDRFGRFRVYEVDGRIIEVYWINTYHYIEGRPRERDTIEIEPFFPSFFSPKLIRNLGITLIILLALFVVYLNKQVVIEEQENDVKTYYHKSDERLTKAFLKSTDCNKIPYYKLVNELGEDTIRVKNTIQKQQADNMKRLVLGPKYNKYY